MSQEGMLSPQRIVVERGGARSEASIAWRYDAGSWVVDLRGPEIGEESAREADAFEALCTIRDVVEPRGWRLGVAGAQADVWPSGMARDQGGGLTCYRMTEAGAAEVVPTFAPVDPAAVVTLVDQRRVIDRLLGPTT